MGKSKIIIISVCSAVVLALSIFLIVWFCGKTYKNFYANATEEFAIPGLETGFTPQGLTHDTSSGNFLISGYMKDESAARVYVVSEDQDVKYFTLTINGEAYTGHCGGIAVYEEYGYIVGEKKVYIFSITDALALDNGKSVECLQVLDAPNGSDFINIHDGKIYIGEFYHEKKYPTDEKHHILSTDGTNPALTYVYDLSSSEQYYFDITSPAFVVSTTEKIQGMCITAEGNVVLSSSWSLSDSKLYIHKTLTEIGATTTYQYNGKTVDVYVLDSSNILKTLVAPSMSEEVALANGKVYVIFENACAKYKTFTRHKNTSAYSFDVADLIAA